MRVLDENGNVEFEELDRDECLQLLGWESLGRLATCAGDGAPEVVPINFVLDGGTVVFRGEPRRAAHLIDHPASFEVDRFDQFRKLGWSVLLSGTVVAVPDADANETVVDAWAPGDRRVLMRLVPERITGRRIAQRPMYLSDLGYL
ncbi:MAG TPA: pyridoxamine 5'-phosphate oxidase family protein [Acidimicrobiales bacterium]|nr:pyridoxamine 5'-phosphate oxidase family protein [Acidimicrobiales bacterium]